jgi:DNA-binding XRE family transcriptional regulator
MDANPAFSDLLKQHRRLLGLSQQALADVVPASRSHTKEIERGAAQPGTGRGPRWRGLCGTGGT